MSDVSGLQVAGNILGQAEQDFAPEEKQTGPDSVLDKNTFLTLLITELQYQDPTEPMKDEDFVAQLAQFSSLEQLTNISEGVDSLNTQQEQGQILDAVSFIGKSVLADGYQISKSGDQVTSCYYTLGDQAQEVYVNIYDQDNNLVQSVLLGAQQAGTYEFTWDGLNYQGSTEPDGVYTIGISAEGVNGEAVSVDTQVSGLVQGIDTSGDEPVLRLEDGREVGLFNVQEVVDSGE